jgi:cation transport protein ChaC
MDAEALEVLDKRECELGGYVRQQTIFFPQGPPSRSFTVEVYIALENNRLWQGEASLEAIATQIMGCRGPSGHNIEYVLCLAAFMHQCVPGEEDEHLFELEKIIWSRTGRQNFCSGALNAGESGGAGGPGDEPDNGPGSCQFADRLPTNKLRCLNM